MTSTFEPAPSQNALTRSIAAGSVPAGGVRMLQRPLNSVAKPASGPEFSVPATGWAGTKDTPSGRCGETASTTEPLTEPTSETIAPCFSEDAISAATGPQAPTGTQKM